MTPAARSLFVFGLYVVTASSAFLIAPDQMVVLLRLPEVGSGWVRMVGLLGLVIGAYDLTGSSAGLVPYIRASIWIRFGFAAGATLLVATREMPPSLLGFAIMDGFGAIWTMLALRRS